MHNQDPQQPQRPQQPYQYRPPQPQQPPADPNKYLRQAGTVAIWVWVLAAVVPVAVVLLCCFGCFAGGIFGGAAQPTPAP